jgi:hypothetical protein
MASNKARDGRLSPRDKLIWLVITMQPVSPSQSPNISQTQSKQRADSNILDAQLAHIPPHGKQDFPAHSCCAQGQPLASELPPSIRNWVAISGIATFIVATKKEPQAEYALGVLVD